MRVTIALVTALSTAAAAPTTVATRAAGSLFLPLVSRLLVITLAAAAASRTAGATIPSPLLRSFPTVIATATTAAASVLVRRLRDDVGNGGCTVHEIAVSCAPSAPASFRDESLVTQACRTPFRISAVEEGLLPRTHRQLASRYLKHASFHTSKLVRIGPAIELNQHARRIRAHSCDPLDAPVVDADSSQMSDELTQILLSARPCSR